MTLLKFKYKLNYVNVYLDSLEKIRPLIYYKTMFIGGKKYRIPVLMPISKSYKISVRWLINSAQSGGSITSLFNEINNSFRGEGSVVKYRKEYHAISFENKTYVRFLRFLKTGF
jgi:ribosomal protein S7